MTIKARAKSYSRQFKIVFEIYGRTLIKLSRVDLTLKTLAIVPGVPLSFDG